MIKKPGVAVKRGFSATKQKLTYEPIRGKTKAPSGTAAKRIASMVAKEGRKKKAKKDSIIAEDPTQLKNPPERQKLAHNLSFLDPHDPHDRGGEEEVKYYAP